MNNARSFLWIALAALGFLLWNAWQNDYHRRCPRRTAVVDDTAQPGAAGTGGDSAAAVADRDNAGSRRRE
jgi:hypothetical protein